MRTREKARIWRRFMAGERVAVIRNDIELKTGFITPDYAIENIIREGATGKFDPLPFNQARVYAAATGVKIRKVVEV
jgi:hypothetical protein